MAVYQILYYENSNKVRRRKLLMEGDLIIYGSYRYVVIGCITVTKQIYLGRLTSLGHLDIISITNASSIDCEWS